MEPVFNERDIDLEVIEAFHRRNDFSDLTEDHICVNLRPHTMHPFIGMNTDTLNSKTEVALVAHAPDTGKAAVVAGYCAIIIEIGDEAIAAVFIRDGKLYCIVHIQRPELGAAAL